MYCCGVQYLYSPFMSTVCLEYHSLISLCRSSRTEPPDLASLMKTTDEIIESLVCPPPPSEMSLNEEMISRMIVPAPSWSKSLGSGQCIIIVFVCRWGHADGVMGSWRWGHKHYEMGNINVGRYGQNVGELGSWRWGDEVVKMGIRILRWSTF